MSPIQIIGGILPPNRSMAFTAPPFEGALLRGSGLRQPRCSHLARELPSAYTEFFFSLWPYSPLDLGRFFSCLIVYTQSVGPFRRGISPSQGRCLHTEQHKYGITHRQPCLESDSNPRPQCVCDRPHIQSYCPITCVEARGKTTEASE
jgi:hypothetical protein